MKLKRLEEDEIVTFFKVLRRNSTEGKKRKPLDPQLFLSLSDISGIEFSNVNV